MKSIHHGRWSLLLPLTLAGAFVAMAPTTQAASSLSLNKAYTLTTPSFGGGGPYDDELHGAPYSNFHTGDLTNGIVAPNGFNPNDGVHKETVSWFKNASATVTIDLGSVQDIWSVIIGTYVYGSNSNGAPGFATASFSTDNVSYGNAVSKAFTAADTPIDARHYDLPAINVPVVSARYVRVVFDGSVTSGNKYMVDEITVIPEPASIAVLGLGAISMLVRRRRSARD